MNDFLVAILNGINSVIHNYGWSMVVFTLLIKLILLPLDYKSRKSMRRMTRLQPQVAKLQRSTPTIRKSSIRRPPSSTAVRASTP